MKMSVWILFVCLTGSTLIHAQVQSVCNITVNTFSGDLTSPGSIQINGVEKFGIQGNTSAFVGVLVDPLCDITSIEGLPNNGGRTDLDLVNTDDLTAFLLLLQNATVQIKGYLLVLTVNCRGPLETLDNVTDANGTAIEPQTDYTEIHALFNTLGVAYARNEVPAGKKFGDFATNTDATCDSWVFFVDVEDYTASTSYLIAENTPSEAINIQFDYVDYCATDASVCDFECSQSLRTFQCDCDTGYRLDADNVTCVEIDECDEDLDNCEHGCQNTNGSFICSCNPGFRLEQAYICNDIDECTEDTDGCGSLCNNTEGSYYCYCADGFQLQDDNITCEDINECDSRPCAHNCSNEDGFYTCDCVVGYTLNDDKHACDDIDECETLNGGCEVDCSNNIGSYSCDCAAGYTLHDGGGCTNIDECARDLTLCDHLCVDNDGGYECACFPGYILASDNKTCDDINECDDGTAACEGSCTNQNGTFFCSCADGLRILNDEKSCEDIDECAIGNGGCSTSCNNTHSSYFCSCDDGYQLLDNNHTCEDIVECDDNKGGCSHICTNEPGSYECSCPEGFLMLDDNHNCQELYCETTVMCQNAGTCEEVQNGATCDCAPGFTGTLCETTLLCYFESCENGGTCNEVDPGDDFSCSCPETHTGDLCETELYCVTSNTCENGATCTSDADGILCDCLPGFSGSNCETEYFCETSNTCENGATCHEEPDGIRCECPPSYTGSNCETSVYCTPVDPCQNGATCGEGSGVAVCDCLPGYTGLMCETKLYCESDPCENEGTCSEVDPGESFSCDCPSGYTDERCSTALYCVLDNHCINGATCEEGTNSAVCDCLDGFSGDSCEHEDLCITSNTCVNGNCEMTEAADDIICSCEPGFDGDNCDNALYCTPVDPCMNEGNCSEGSGVAVCACPDYTTGTWCETVLFCTPDNPCQNGGTCTELPNEGGAECDCVTGWQSRYCNLDADECAFGTDDCGDRECINTPGSFTCECYGGYQLADDNCQDINECAVDNGNCSDTCNNNDGSYTCSCPTGYRIKPDQRTCTDIDECIYEDTCGENCTNTAGSYMCSCQDGYQLQADQKTCEDIDECSDDNGGCSGTCVNNLGTYRCTCDSDAALQQDGKTCVGIPTSLTFTSSAPTYGPSAGGTRVTVLGSIPAVYTVTGVLLKLPADIDQETLATDAQDTLHCTLNETGETSVVFDTPAVTTGSTGMNYTIDISYTDTAENLFTVKTGYTFLYKPDPVITTVYPIQFKRSGGTPVTVKGRYFYSVHEPKLCVHIERRELEASTGTYTIIEKHKICTTDVTKMSSTQMIATFPEIPMSLLLRTRRKRQAELTPINDDLLNIFIGWDLDGVEMYVNLEEALGVDSAAILVYDEPTVEMYTDILRFNPKEEEYIEIKGDGFALGATAEDYTVTIGAEPCPVTSMTNTLVTCVPPEEEPQPVQGPYYKREIPHIMLSVGNFQAHVGYIDYTGRDKTLMYVLIGIVSAIVLVGLVVLLVHIILPRRNRRKNIYREQVDDPQQLPRILEHEDKRRNRNGNTPVADFHSPGWQPPTRKYYSRR